MFIEVSLNLLLSWSNPTVSDAKIWKLPSKDVSKEASKTHTKTDEKSGEMLLL